MPAMPPTALSVSASARNCSRTSRRRAPTARRTPISRVRSLTATSMMFMMPTPPTTSETAAMPARSAVIVVLARCSVAFISARFTSSTFGMFARMNAATDVYSPLVSASCDCVFTVKSSGMPPRPLCGIWLPVTPPCTQLLHRRVDVRRVPRPQQRRHLGRNARRLAGLLRFDRDGVQIRDAERILQRGVRHERHLDLIGIGRVGDADDGERRPVNGDGLPDGVGAGAEDLIARRAAQHRHRTARRDVGRREEASLDKAPAEHRRERHVGAEHLPVEAARRRRQSTRAA